MTSLIVLIGFCLFCSSAYVSKSIGTMTFMFSYMN